MAGLNGLGGTPAGSVGGAQGSPSPTPTPTPGVGAGSSGGGFSFTPSVPPSVGGTQGSPVCSGCNPNANLGRGSFINSSNPNSSVPPNINSNLNPNSMFPNQPFSNWRGCTPPAPINLFATVGAAPVDNLFLGDSDDLYASYGGAGINSQEFDVSGPATIANLKKRLQSMWYYISCFTLTSSNVATLQKTLQLFTADMDGLSKGQTISSGANAQNTQFNPNMLNVCCGFFLTYATALKLGITVAGETVNLTLTIGACGSYGGDLADFLAQNPNLSCLAGCQSCK